jgi:hypothetical protein
MTARNLAGALLAVAIAALPGLASAATVSGADRENIRAACAQTHDTCLQSCNAAYPGTNVLAQGLRTDCQNSCNSALFACNKSVDLKATPVPQSALPANRKLFP